MVRSQTYWLGRQSAEETSLRGVLVDLAEGGSSAVIVVRGSGPCPGTVRLVGDDFAVVESVPGQLLVPLAAVEAIRSAPGRSLPRGRLVALSGVTLRCLLTELSADRPRMVATSTSGERSAGELRSVGADVIRMVDPTTRSDVLVPLESVCEVLLPTQ